MTRASDARLRAARQLRLAKARKLIEALAEECETRGGEHAWRKCRACLAREELDHHGVKAMLRDWLASQPAPTERDPVTGFTDEETYQVLTDVIAILDEHALVGTAALDLIRKRYAP